MNLNSTIGPQAVCKCGHTGDGEHSQHKDTLIEPGHGKCLEADCLCIKFTWKGWLAQITN